MVIYLDLILERKKNVSINYIVASTGNNINLIQLEFIASASKQMILILILDSIKSIRSAPQQKFSFTKRNDNKNEAKHLNKIKIMEIKNN